MTKIVDPGASQSPLTYCHTAMRFDRQLAIDSQGTTTSYSCPICGRRRWFRDGQELDRTGLPPPAPKRQTHVKNKDKRWRRRRERERFMDSISLGVERTLAGRSSQGLCGCGCGNRLNGIKFRWLKGHQWQWIEEMRFAPVPIPGAKA